MTVNNDQYAALTTSAAWCNLGSRTQIELRGGDRHSFLHNLCTNDIKSLAPGHGREAFLTDVQGKAVGHVLVFADADALILDTSPDQGDVLLPHLDRYLITEDVQLLDRSADCADVLLAGPNGADTLRALGVATVPEQLLDHSVHALSADLEIAVRRVAWTGQPSYLLKVPIDSTSELGDALTASGATAVDANVIETARIEFGFPLFGIDITRQNLPQEVDRNQVAISFTKGCYLGQETIARIDALGHVNHTLRGLKFAGSEVPQPGSELQQDGKPVARVTSATWSPQHAAPFALAYVRRGHETPSTQLSGPWGQAEVVALGDT